MLHSDAQNGSTQLLQTKEVHFDLEKTKKSQKAFVKKGLVFMLHSDAQNGSTQLLQTKEVHF